MPVSVITDVVTWIELIAQIGVTTVELGVLSYLVFDNGWLDMIRLISFWVDKLIIKYVDKFYSYFDKILNGTIFAPDVVERVMSGVYLFVTVLVLFKLVMLFMKYITNPDAVSDDKMGAASLVKRVIIGMVLMLFLNNIFTLGYRLQSAILTDNLFGQILLTKSQLRSYEKNKNQMGRVLAFNVYQGFWNLDKKQVNSDSLIKKYENAIAARDPGVFGSINEKYGDDYAIDYFPILSTIVVGYVLYLIIKYCIDIIVRMFKLFVLQMLGPIAITDYMVNGDSKEMFKSWVKTTIAAYAMLFMRVFCIWFVAFITILMDQKCTNVENGICTDSLLYVIEGQEPDYLLRGLITLGLLAFLMDLPKLLSTVFGLDLEQDASVKGLLGKAGGVAKMLGMGALAAGGAAIGGAIGGMKAGSNALKQFGNNQAATKAKLAKLNPNDPNYAAKSKAIQQKASLQNRSLSAGAAGAMGASFGGIMAAGLSQTPIGTAIGASQNATTNVQNKANEASNIHTAAIKAREDNLKTIESEEEKENHQKEKEENNAYRLQKLEIAQAQLEQQQNLNVKLGVNENIDSIDVVSKADALKDAGKLSSSDTIIGNLQNMNQTIDATRDTVVNINDNVETVVNTTNDIKNDVHTTASTVQNIEQSTDVIRNNTANIQDNTEVIANSTMNIENNIDTIVEENQHISHVVDQIEDNTFYSGVDSIESLDSGTPGDKIGGVSVSNPDSLTGERTTASGIILPGSVDVDNKQ